MTTDLVIPIRESPAPEHPFKESLHLPRTAKRRDSLVPRARRTLLIASFLANALFLGAGADTCLAVGELEAEAHAIGPVAVRLDDHSLCRDPVVDRPLPAPDAPFLAPPFRKGIGVLGAPVRPSLSVCLPGTRLLRYPPHLPDRLHPLHHPALGALHDIRRDRPERLTEGYARSQHRDAPDRDGAGLLGRHDGRFDGDDPAGPPGQQTAREEGARLLFLHLPRGQHRGLAHPAGRPAPLPGVPAQRPLLLGDDAHPAPHAGRLADPSGPLLPHRPVSLPERGAGSPACRRDRGEGRAARDRGRSTISPSSPGSWGSSSSAATGVPAHLGPGRRQSSSRTCFGTG